MPAANEKDLRAADADVPFPGWDRLAEESLEEGPKVLLTIRDADGRAERRLEGPATAGIHRVSWDLRLPPIDPVNLAPVGFRPPWASDPQGPLAAPGTYFAEMALRTHSGVTSLGEPQSFVVRPVPGTALPAADGGQVAAFQAETAELARRIAGAAQVLQEVRDRLTHLRRALSDTPRADPALFAELTKFEAIHARLATRLAGDGTRQAWNEASNPSIQGRVERVAGAHWQTRQNPTETQRLNVEIAARQFEEIVGELHTLAEKALPAFEAKLEAAGAPWTPGRRVVP